MVALILLAIGVLFGLIIQKQLILLSLPLLVIAACVRNQPQIVVITSTPDMIGAVDSAPLIQTSTSVSPTAISSETTPINIPTVELQSNANNQEGLQYVVQPGDTLSAIAAANGISLEILLSINDIPDPNTLAVGQVINLPEAPHETTSSFNILPDSRLVRGPGSSSFDVGAFIRQQPGYIQTVTDTVDDETVNAIQIVQRVAIEYSVDPRLLLALLEYRSGWLTHSDLDDTLINYPMELQPSPAGFDRSGLYKQLSWTANQLNLGYYGWKDRDWKTLEFQDGTRLLYDPNLNAATVGIQYFLSQNVTYMSWLPQVEVDGFYSTYYTYFGDPFANAPDSTVPPGIVQPVLTLPFSSGETWFYTGGPHGGWGSGSAWAAIDFAPPDERSDDSPPCYTSDYWATAVAPSMIVRSSGGAVILDLDMDGDEFDRLDHSVFTYCD